MSIELSVASLSALLASTALALLWRLHTRFNAVLKGSEGKGLEKTLVNHIAQVQKVSVNLDKLETNYKRLATALSLASQKISIVRFNPFGDTGGDQSFTLAVLDAHNSGYVITSIHGREGTRVYVKPVDNGKSKYTLSSEEKQALMQASKRVAQNG